MNNLVNWVASEESGQGMVEYGLIVALIGVTVAAALTTMSGSLSDIFNNISSKLAAAGK